MSSLEEAEAEFEPRLQELQVEQHFGKLQPLLSVPWELSWEERRRLSRDPRIVKQVADEDQWERTVVSGLWKRLRVYCLPRHDWRMDKEAFAQFAAASGVRTKHFVDKLFEVFDHDNTGFINGLVLTKVLEIALTDPMLGERFARHCFDRFDRSIGSDEISVSQLMSTQLRNPDDVVEAKGKKKNHREAPECTINGARYHSVEGLKQLVQTAPQLQGAQTITFSAFRELFTDPSNGEWVGTFVLHLLECAAKYFSPPAGRLPTVPLRWLQTTEPVPPTEDVFDADIILLREVESAGIDPNAQDKKKKKGKSGKGKRKK